MIEASARNARSLEPRLAARARRLAEAHAEAQLRAARNDPQRWQIARLLWPLL